MQQSYPQKPQGSFAFLVSGLYFLSFTGCAVETSCLSVCLSICPSPPYSALGLFHMGAESTFLHHASTQTAEGLRPTGQELAVVSIVLCRQPSAAFSPSTITPVASPSHRGCTHVRRSHLSALPSAFVSIGPASWSSSSLK